MSPLVVKDFFLLISSLESTEEMSNKELVQVQQTSRIDREKSKLIKDLER